MEFYYHHYLIVLSAAFLGLERLRPWRRRQRVLRRGLFEDLFYLAFNGHFLGLLLAQATVHTAAWFATATDQVGLYRMIHAGVASGWPIWVQVLVAFVGLDFVQWSVHNALHRVPWLWEFHKVHHSIEELDWIGNFRFHWVEVIVYKAAQYLPLILLGFDGGVLLAFAVVQTASGFFNHANLDVDIGPLKYVLNNPRMHVWHHDRDEIAPPGVNFAILFSAWDWIFGTAWLPDDDRQPRRLGFDGLEEFPRSVPGQVVHPVPLPRRKRRPSGAA
mgnify:FL=1